YAHHIRAGSTAGPGGRRGTQIYIPTPAMANPLGYSASTAGMSSIHIFLASLAGPINPIRRRKTPGHITSSKHNAATNGRSEPQRWNSGYFPNLATQKVQSWPPRGGGGG